MRLQLFGKTFLLWLIPNTFVFIGQSNTVPKWLIKNLEFLKGSDPDVLKDWCTIIGLVFTGVVLPYTIASIRETNKRQQQALNEVLVRWKDLLTDIFRKTAGKPNFTLNVRIFVKKKWYQFPPLQWIQVIRGERIEFMLINLPNLAEQDNTNGLCFEVKPLSQGLVGVIYNSDAVVIDSAVRQSGINYNLTNFQNQRVNHIKFIMGGPVYDPKSGGTTSGKIIGIITFDSQEAINTLNYGQKEKFKEIVLTYSDLIHKYLPLLTPKN